MLLSCFWEKKKLRSAEEEETKVLHSLNGLLRESQEGLENEIALNKQSFKKRKNSDQESHDRESPSLGLNSTKHEEPNAKRQKKEDSRNNGEVLPKSNVHTTKVTEGSHEEGAPMETEEVLTEVDANDGNTDQLKNRIQNKGKQVLGEQ